MNPRQLIGAAPARASRLVEPFNFKDWSPPRILKHYSATQVGIDFNIELCGKKGGTCDIRDPVRQRMPYPRLASVPVLFQLSAMGRKRFAIITFDPDRVAKLSWQGEGHSLAWIVWRGLCGWTYPKERGIINITLMD